MPLDLKRHLEESLRGCAELWAKDLAAHRDDAFSNSFSGARSVADLAYETVLVNQRVAARLRGETVAPLDGFPPCPEEIRSREAVTKALGESVEEVLAAVGDPEREVPSPYGGTTTAFARAEFAVSHMFYHLGQVNYVQAQYGDPEVHWA